MNKRTSAVHQNTAHQIEQNLTEIFINAVIFVIEELLKNLFYYNLIKVLLLCPE